MSQGSDPVNVLLDRVQQLGTEYFVDGDDMPCIRIKDDPVIQEYRLRDGRGRPNERVRAWLRSQYRYATEQKKHLDDAALEYTVDYLAEDAYRGGRKRTRTEIRKDGDYNFEAVVVFAGTLTKDSPGVTVDAKANSLTLAVRTADLWRAINDPTIEAQVTKADKATLYKAINFFSGRLAEHKEAGHFRKEGLEVDVTHREDGSWVTIIRHDDVFHPGPVLVRPDDLRPSSSAASSGPKAQTGRELDHTDNTDIELEPLDNQLARSIP